MADPDYIAQTFEAEHLIDPKSVRRWFIHQIQISHAQGCTWPRMTVNEDQTGLLFEAWIERPKDQGEPRWQLSPTQEDTP